MAWDVKLDGRRRFDVRFTVILDPALGLITWVHFAPPIGDGLRKSYHRLLRWNDEFPFVKFSLAEDGRPTLSTEIPFRLLDRDELGVALARSLAICDALLEESAGWLWIGGRIPDQSAAPAAIPSSSSATPTDCRSCSDRDPGADGGGPRRPGDRPARRFGASSPVAPLVGVAPASGRTRPAPA